MLWLKAVPWSAIISNAPLIVDGAKKLVALVRNNPSPAADIPVSTNTFAGGPPSEFEALSGRIGQLEVEQRQAAELLRSMAESQAQMAQALEALRRRAKLNLRIALIALVGLLVLWAWTATR